VEVVPRRSAYISLPAGPRLAAIWSGEGTEGVESMRGSIPFSSSFSTITFLLAMIA
jgi:hypothetical protein